jgi:23S rRNA pseudouridine1911/1915/1917 synthase
VIRFRAPTRGRADRLVAAEAPQSRKLLARAFEAGLVRANGRRVKKGDLLAVGDLIEIEEPPPLSPVAQPELPLRTLYLDDDLIALDKGPLMPSHPLVGAERGTLANALVARHPECATAGADPREGGLVHRLDSGTTGVIVAARSRAAWEAAREATRGGRVKKEYLALVLGRVASVIEIDAPIAHDRERGGVRVGDREGALDALTIVTPVREVGPWSLVRCELRVGRMHQVRAHLAWRGWPIVGDERYGGPAEPRLSGHFLHASRIELPHPMTQERLVVDAPLPEDRRGLLDLGDHPSGEPPAGDG